MFIPDGDQIVSKTYMTRVESENTRLRHYLARLKRKTLCYSKCEEMLKHSNSIRLLIHYLKFGEVPIPDSVSYSDRRHRLPLEACAPPKRRSPNHILIQQRPFFSSRSRVRRRRSSLEQLPNGLNFFPS
jgi:IS1 transposase